MEELMLSDFGACYQATVAKTVWCWRKKQPINSWNRIESAEIDAHKYS